MSAFETSTVSFHSFLPWTRPQSALPCIGLNEAFQSLAVSPAAGPLHLAQPRPWAGWFGPCWSLSPQGLPGPPCCSPHFLPSSTCALDFWHLSATLCTYPNYILANSFPSSAFQERFSVEFPSGTLATPLLIPSAVWVSLRYWSLSRLSIQSAAFSWFFPTSFYGLGCRLHKSIVLFFLAGVGTNLEVLLVCSTFFPWSSIVRIFSGMISYQCLISPVCWIFSVLLVSCSLFLHDFCFILFLSSLVPEAPSAYDVGCVRVCVGVLFSPVKYSSLRNQALLLSRMAHLRTSVSQSDFSDCLVSPGTEPICLESGWTNVMRDAAQRTAVSRCSWGLCRHRWQWRWCSPPPPPRPFVGPLFGPGAGLPLDMHRLSLQTVMPNRKSLCPCFTDKETESERSLPQMVGVEPGFVQAGWSPVCVLTTGHLSLPQVKLAHPCPFFQT